MNTSLSFQHREVWSRKLLHRFVLWFTDVKIKYWERSKLLCIRESSRWRHQLVFVFLIRLLLVSSSLSSQRQLRDFRPPAFSYSASILDLDPKPFDSIPRQLRLDQKIVTCYLRTGGALPKGPVREKEDCTLLFHPMWAPSLSPEEEDNCGPDAWWRGDAVLVGFWPPSAQSCSSSLHFCCCSARGHLWITRYLSDFQVFVLLIQEHLYRPHREVNSNICHALLERLLL